MAQVPTRKVSTFQVPLHQQLNRPLKAEVGMIVRGNGWLPSVVGCNVKASWQLGGTHT